MPPDGPGPGAVVIGLGMPADLPDLLRIEQVFGADALSRRSMFDLVRSSAGRVFVARVGGRIVGDAIVLRPRKRKKARLYSLAVDASARCGGVGTRLLRYVEDWARSEGRTHLTLEVRADNGAAVALYEKLGYTRTGRAERYYADGTDALRYEKRLGV